MNLQASVLREELWTDGEEAINLLLVEEEGPSTILYPHPHHYYQQVLLLHRDVIVYESNPNERTCILPSFRPSKLIVSTIWACLAASSNPSRLIYHSNWLKWSATNYKSLPSLIHSSSQPIFAPLNNAVGWWPWELIKSLTFAITDWHYLQNRWWWWWWAVKKTTEMARRLRWRCA